MKRCDNSIKPLKEKKVKIKDINISNLSSRNKLTIKVF